MTIRAQAYIFARGGSKGVPRKNIRLAAGKPLLAHAIDSALACKYVTSVIVSTDDEEIAEAALRYGAKVPFMRPAHLAGDTASEWDAWRHALEHSGCTPSYAPFDVFLSVPTTSPLRLPQDLDACVELLFQEADTDMVITVRPAERHPSFNMVSMERGGAVRLAAPLPGVITRRQDAPALYDITTVGYAAKPAYILRAHSLFEGETRAVHVPQERALDIDSEYELKIADFLLRERMELCAR
jgi:N-acylneuraminate cytidylyltransferase